MSSELPSGFREHRCYEIACGDCGMDVWDSGDHDGRPHFDAARGVEAIVKMLLDDYEWTNDGILLCRRCSERRTCLNNGHTWDDWRSSGDGTAVYRYCQVCDEYERRDHARA